MPVSTLIVQSSTLSEGDFPDLPICTYVSQSTSEADAIPSSVSFIQFYGVEGPSIESVPSALSKLGIQPDEAHLLDTDIRLYKALRHTSLKGADYLMKNPSFLVSVALSPLPTPEAEADFNAWYEEEHISLLSEVPGWQACRRFSLVDTKSTVNGISVPRYLALHAYVHLDGFTTPQYKAARNTPWRTRIMQGIVAQERNVYLLTTDNEVYSAK